MKKTRKPREWVLWRRPNGAITTWTPADARLFAEFRGTAEAILVREVLKAKGKKK